MTVTIASKLVTMDVAIRRFVEPGSTVFVGGMQHGEPTAAIHEIVRQRIGRLTLVPALTQSTPLLVGEGLVETLIQAYTTDLYPRRGFAFEKARARGTFPRLLELSHFGLCLALTAGQLGVPFMPTMTQLGSDLETWNPEYLARVDCPFTGAKLGAVKAIRPDVAIVHVQRADAAGNAQKHGSLGMDRMGLHAAKRVIVTAERIVPTDEIREAPGLTLIPGFLVSAVVDEPWGAYPIHLSGCYGSDVTRYRAAMASEDAYEAWMRAYVYGVRNRTELIDTLSRELGSEHFERLRASAHAG